MPHYPKASEGVGHEYQTSTFWEHLVCGYSGLSIAEVQSLDLEEYLMLRRDAFIDRLSQTEDGQQYLRDAWRLQCTAPDRGRLRKKLRGEG